MGESRAFWNGDPASIDKALMGGQDLRAIANYFRACHGADSFAAALEHAHALTAKGELATAAMWNQIAEEISHIETSDTLRRCLEREAAAS